MRGFACALEAAKYRRHLVGDGPTAADSGLAGAELAAVEGEFQKFLLGSGLCMSVGMINRAGTTVVMATHDREMVDSMRKRVIALEAGHVVRDQERGGYGYYGAL